MSINNEAAQILIVHAIGSVITTYTKLRQVLYRVLDLALNIFLTNHKLSRLNLIIADCH